jgi:hypothetical protein
MANIKLRRGSGVPSGLTFGEPAFDITNSRLYVGITGGSALVGVAGGGVHSFNGLTGAVTGVTTGTANTFGPLQSFTSGISSSGGAFDSPVSIINSSIIGAATPSTFFVRNTQSSVTSNNSASIIGTTGGAYSALELRNTGNTAGSEVVFNMPVFNGTSGLNIRQNSTISGPTTWSVTAYDAIIRTGQSSARLHLAGGNNRSPMMTITETGAVGIGTTSPGVTFDIVGAMRASELITASSGISSSGGTFGTLRVEQPNIATLNVRSSAGGGSVNITTNQGNCGSIGSINNIPFAFTTNGADRVLISSDGNVGIRTTNPGATLDVVGTFRASQLSQFTGGLSAAGGITFNSAFTGSTATFNGLIISTAGFSGTGITLSGNLSAATKSFLIPHPIQPNKKLQYACLEGPENGVYVRGRLTGSNVIDLPDYWTALVHSDSITVQLTANGSQKNYFVKSIEENRIIVGSKSKDIDCFYLVQGERKDVPKLTVEY